MVVLSARRWLNDSHHTYSTGVPSRLPTNSANSMYKPLSAPSDLLNGKLSGSEQTLSVSAANEADMVTAAKAVALTANLTIRGNDLDMVQILLKLDDKFENLKKSDQAMFLL